MNKFQLEREALPAIALTTDSSVLTSIANDYDYSRVFAHQVEAWAKEGDVVIGISTSGNSANVIEAVKVAREKGAHLDGVYYCPHHPTEGIGKYKKNCWCRKPNPGMLEKAVVWILEKEKG